MSGKFEPTAAAVEPRRELKQLSARTPLGVAFGIFAACLIVGIGAGIGAGYGIFHEDSTQSTTAPISEEWLVVVSADNGTMAVDPNGLTIFQLDGLRERAPAYTNVPDRIATLATMDTALDFIDEGISNDGGSNVIMSFQSGNDTHMFPLVVDEKINATGDSATYIGAIYPEFLRGFNETLSWPFEDAKLFVLAGSAPSSLDFS